MTNYKPTYQELANENARLKKELELLQSPDGSDPLLRQEPVNQSMEELVRYKEKMGEIEEIFNQFLKYSPIYIFFKDSEIRPVYLSHNFEKMLGMPLIDQLGKSMDELFPSELAKQMVADDRRILREDKFYEIEEELDGRFYSTIKFPIHLKGKPNFLAGFTIDITERKTNELLLNEKHRALVAAKEKAEESDRLKSAFLSNMSHEIRTPMSGILGIAELLKVKDLSGEDLKKYVSLIERSSLRMLNIIKDLISISKIESGHLEIFYEKVNLNKLMEALFGSFHGDATTNGLTLKMHCPVSTSDFNIHTDPEKITAILSHLIKNAIKFSSSGSVEFGYDFTMGIHESSLHFYVKDDGIGIPQHQQKMIFEPFFQTDSSLSREYEGARLGLSISKAFIEALGGTIWLDSALGQGTTVHFALPLKAEAS